MAWSVIASHTNMGLIQAQESPRGRGALLESQG